MRRYPALAFLVAAAALALLLPSGLIVPQSGPPTLAEYAPVPGEGSGQGNVSEFGQSTSGGLGEGKEATAQGETQTAGSAGKAVRKAGTKKCVGNPPRQAEDPLSPPCIAFFDGDNSGDTARGVSANEVRVIVEIETATGDRKNGLLIDCAGPPQDDDDHRDRACRAYMRYFNDRYQTYGRTVHLWSAHKLSDFWADANEQVRPFAVAGSSSGALKSNVMNATFSGQRRKSYQEKAPYLISFMQDLNDQASISATYICRRLNGAKARFAGDATLREKKRKFGLWASSDNQTETLLLQEQLKTECGIEAYYVSSWQDQTGAAQMQRENVTTVIVQMLEAGISGVTNSSTRQGFFPEWIVPGVNGLRGVDTNFVARTFPVQAQWANALGVTFDLRRDAFGEQPWNRAYKEGCPDCPAFSGTDSVAVIQGYQQLAMMFYGIQAAGPKLTVQNFDRGMHAIPVRQSPNAYTPAAYFSPGNYSFIKDSAAIWWDLSGKGPGSTAAGCWRLPEAGRRYRAGEWPEGDGLVKAEGPCQGDVVQS